MATGKINAVLSKSAIYNGLDKTAAGFTLDARQGKTLKDSITTLSNKVNASTYTSVTQLGLTAGAPTILEAYNAMPNSSILIANGQDFVSSECPSINGTAQTTVIIAIHRVSNARSTITATSKDASMEWVMGLFGTTYNNNSANAPSGRWDRVNRFNLNPSFNGDIDTLLKTGIYYLDGGTSTTVSGQSFYGTLYVAGNAFDNANGTRVTQLYIGAGGVGMWQRRYTGSWQQRQNLERKRGFSASSGGVITMTLPSPSIFRLYIYRSGTSQTGAFGMYTGFAGSSNSSITPLFAPTGGSSVEINGLQIKVTTSATNVGAILDFDFFE